MSTPQWNKRTVGSQITQNTDNAPAWNPPSQHNFLSPEPTGHYPTASVQWGYYVETGKDTWPLGDKPGNAVFNPAMLATILAEPSQIVSGGSADPHMAYHGVNMGRSKANTAMGKRGY